LEEKEHKSCRNKSITKSLGEIIAEEKTGNIHLQRRSIKALGKDILRLLIIHIFKNISASGYQDNAVAKAFGLSKPTFSRFAGSRWKQTKSTIPDLWRNTAHVLSTYPDFKQAAIEAGVWEQVEATLNRNNEERTRSE